MTAALFDYIITKIYHPKTLDKRCNTRKAVLITSRCGPAEAEGIL